MNTEDQGIINKILLFFKKELVLTIAFVLAIISSFIVLPDEKYIDYIDFRSLGILWGLMLIMAGLKKIGFFELIGRSLLSKTDKVWSLVASLVGLCFVSSMFITNDVALITFVPFAIFLLDECKKTALLIPVVALQTVAANLGSMLTPIGNPQNLYLYNLSGMGLLDFVLLLLPYSLAALVMLIISICLLKGKNDKILPGNKEQKTELNYAKLIIYALLFVLALLVVAKLVPYYILVIAALALIAIIDFKVILTVDYALLFTFIGFFVFTGNIGRIDFISDFLQNIVDGHEVLSGVVTSQFMSNVPAALLLSGFTTDIPALTVGVNLGGLGTLIASMASLISYKQLANSHSELKGKYMIYFTGINILFLAVLLIVSMF